MFNKIIRFWKTKLKSGEQIYLILILVTILLSIYIAYIELSPIGKLAQDISDYQSKIKKLEEAIDYNEHLETLFSVYYSVGRSLESQREEIKLDAMGATSIDLNFHMKNIIMQQCLNINSLSDFLNQTVDCEQIVSVEVVFDKSELNKLSELKVKLVDMTGNFKKELSTMESNKQDLVGRRNFLYVLLIFISGVGIAYNYLIQKLYDAKS